MNAIKWDPTGTLLASCSDDYTAKVCCSYFCLVVYLLQCFVVLVAFIISLS